MKTVASGVRALAAIPALAIVVAAPSSEASHYRLPADGLVTSGEERALREADVDTTRALLEASDGLEEREDLAERTGLPTSRLTELATQCDLLRVEGIGPKMVLLLQDAGVSHTDVLAGAESESLARRLDEANDERQRSEIVPSAETVTDWIRQAQELPSVLEGVP